MKHAYHVRGPTVLASDEDTGRVRDTVRDNDLLNLVTEGILDGLAEVIELSSLIFTSLLLLFGFLQLETLLRDADQLLAVKLLQLSDGILIDGVDEKEDLEALLLENLEERRILDGGERFTGQVVDRLLDLRHPGDVVLERGLLIGRLGRVEPEVLGELGSVLAVFVDAELDVLSESLVELGKVVLVLSDLGEQFHALLDEILANDLQDLVLLEGFTGDVEGEVLGVDDTLDKVEVLGNKVFAVVHDKDAADVKLDVVALLLRLEEIEWSPWRDTSEGVWVIDVENTHLLGMKRMALNSS